MGYSSSDEIIFEDVKYLLDPSRQPSNGFWESIDMTSAVIQALRGFENITGVPEAISKAENYLISNQGSDNGFGNSFSTSWVLQSLFNNSQILKAENYLALNQQTDGGMEDTTSDISNRIWSTSYAIPAILHKSWKSIMQSFEKPVTQNDSSSSVLENINLQTLPNPVICPKGDLFSTTTGQACTTTNDTNIITINTPISNQNLDLVIKKENKKITEVSLTENIWKSDFH
ncbi:MAG: hypothetical protein Q8P60_11535, partial [Pseudorhodobacter sp.]|nr:hypothetical protein [Pseudorhodobacter sp.]